ncbi:class I SAM-dependent methyltransferase [Actinokineospora inagensis]|uniref:class I SAM-dependent methyltransferase n=1 Tax=Actinokineospora inagensis TaxID=103730 RepID=UPI00041D74CE|nr:methyltransferase domain-containing protein [Actinokineospora inagensis]
MNTAFHTHTDQHRAANRHLADLADRLPRHTLFVDAGAGTGETTGHLAPRFTTTIALEPDPTHHERLATNAPTATIRGEGILHATIDTPADLVYCGHVLGHIPLDRWQTHLDTLTGWTAHDGYCVIALQNPASDCMRILREFGGPRLDLTREAVTVVDTVTIPGFVQAPDLDTAVDIAASFVALAPLPVPRDLIEDYVRTHFAAAGGYLFSCTQDFHHITRA